MNFVTKNGMFIKKINFGLFSMLLLILLAKGLALDFQSNAEIIAYTCTSSFLVSAILGCYAACVGICLTTFPERSARSGKV